MSVEIVILKDGDGNFYALPKAGIVSARIPDEHRAEVEALIAADSELSDAQLESVDGGLRSVATYAAPQWLVDCSGSMNWDRQS